MKSFLNETNIKIALIGLMLIGMIFLSNFQKNNLDFYINDLSVMNAKANRVDEVAKGNITNNFEITSGNNTVSEKPLAENQQNPKVENAINKQQKKENLVAISINNNLNESESKNNTNSNNIEKSLPVVERTNISQIISTTSTEQIMVPKVRENISPKVEEKVVPKAEEIVPPNQEMTIIPKTEKTIVPKTEQTISAKEEKQSEIKVEKTVTEEEKPILKVEENGINKEQEKNTSEVENKIIVKSEEKVIKQNDSIKNFKVNEQGSMIRTFFVVCAIIANLMVYYYVYNHLADNIKKEFKSLKPQYIELEDSYSYRSIVDI